MFRSILHVGGATLALSVFAVPAMAEVLPLAVDAQAFAAREAASQMDLSPDGKRVVYVGPGPGRSSVVYVADLDAAQARPILRANGDPEAISWCGFVGNERLVCRYETSVRDTGVLIGFSRTISLNVDGSDAKQLGQRSSSYDARIRQFDGSVIDWLPGEGESVLMTREFIPEAGNSAGSRVVRDEDGLGVVKINVRTLKAEQVEKPNRAASRYLTDGRGIVRLMVLRETGSGGALTGRKSFRYRAAGSRNWLPLADTGGDLIPLAVDADSDSLYALKPLQGRNALYRVNLAPGLASTLVASNPKVDIDDVVRAGSGNKVVGYTFADDRRHTVYFDEEYTRLAKGLAKALPSLPLLNFIGANGDNNKLLLVATADNDAGKYFAFDKVQRSLAPIFPTRPQLAGRTLATVKAVTYAATDGTSIPAYLTFPAGLDVKNAPAVVYPHGGPTARDEWGFDWLPQFLAARGYVVIQPNFRGSAGFGEAWMTTNGFKSWRTSIGDISAAARWLVAQGIADPNRIAIVGWSYGGYAALQGAATEPSLYRAVVAIAPVTDLQLWKNEFADFDISNTQARFVGSGPHIVEGSPLRNAAAITAPVLLVHGDMDANVGVAESRQMAEALRSAGRSPDYLEFKGLDHGLNDSSSRQQMLTKIGELLERTIGH